MPLSNPYKVKIVQECKKIISLRIANANKAMQAAQEAANADDKSSAGDKYETSRAMGHRDRDMYARQLLEANNELKKLGLINLEPSDTVRLGALVETDESRYFIAVGLGKIEIDGQSIVVISKESPLMGSMGGKKTNDEFNFNSKKGRIINIL